MATYSCGQRDERSVRRLGLIPALFFAVALTACGGSIAAVTPSAPNTVQMTEFAFAPKVITVPHGAKVTVVNDGKIDHTWTVTSLGRGSGTVTPGASTVVDLSGVAPGTYALVCILPGHAAAGQVGTLIVTP